MNDLYASLPVWVVDSYDEVTKEKRAYFKNRPHALVRDIACVGQMTTSELSRESPMDLAVNRSRETTLTTNQRSLVQSQFHTAPFMLRSERLLKLQALSGPQVLEQFDVVALDCSTLSFRRFINKPSRRHR